MNDLDRRELESQRELLRKVVEEQDRQSSLKGALDDNRIFYGQMMRLRIDPPAPGDKIRHWRNLADPLDPYNTMDRFLDEPYTGKIKYIFAPRGVGKTYGVLVPRLVRRILRDKNTTIGLFGENANEVLKRSLLVRSFMEALEKDYGPLVTNRWAADAWTVMRDLMVGGQDTITVGSPDKPGTSQHWGLGAFDDAVGEETCRNAANMAKGISWGKELLGSQAMAGTEIWGFGTFWPGRNFHRFLVDDLEGGLKDAEPYGKGKVYRGEICDFLFFDSFDDDGQPIFSCLDPKLLETKKKILGEAGFNAQFRNWMLSDLDTCFKPQWFSAAEKAPSGLKICMTTDTATSVGRVKHTSISCVLVVGKDARDHAWMLDGFAGKYGWDQVPGMVLDLILRWKPHRIWTEKTGPSVQLKKAVTDAAELKQRGLGAYVRQLFREVSRTLDKPSRIEAGRPSVEAGKLHFADTFPSKLYHLGKWGPEGIMGKQFMTFTYGAGDSYDCLDAWADVWGYDGDGSAIFTPPPGAGKGEEWTPENTWDVLKKYYDSRASAKCDDAS